MDTQNVPNCISFNVISLQSANTNLDYLFFLLNETTG